MYGIMVVHFGVCNRIHRVDASKTRQALDGIGD